MENQVNQQTFAPSPNSKPPFSLPNALMSIIYSALFCAVVAFTILFFLSPVFSGVGNFFPIGVVSLWAFSVILTTPVFYKRLKQVPKNTTQEQITNFSKKIGFSIFFSLIISSVFCLSGYFLFRPMVECTAQGLDALGCGLGVADVFGGFLLLWIVSLPLLSFFTYRKIKYAEF